jgi:hypothetical protein
LGWFAHIIRRCASDLNAILVFCAKH